MKKVIIAGSSRNDGDTKRITDLLIKHSNWDLINLNDYDFSYYDYEHRNRDDDCINLIRKIVDEYDTLIFITPVYWYAMSGIMKVFFDRLTDLITIEKELGRKLRGKSTAAISCSGGDNLGEAFWLPFSKTAKYLGMDYHGNMHLTPPVKNVKELTNFIKLIDHSF